MTSYTHNKENSLETSVATPSTQYPFQNPLSTLRDDLRTISQGNASKSSPTSTMTSTTTTTSGLSNSSTSSKKDQLAIKLPVVQTDVLQSKPLEKLHQQKTSDSPMPLKKRRNSAKYVSGSAQSNGSNFNIDFLTRMYKSIDSNKRTQQSLSKKSVPVVVEVPLPSKPLPSESDGKNEIKMNLTMNLNLLTGMFKSIDNNKRTRQSSVGAEKVEQPASAGNAPSTSSFDSVVTANEHQAIEKKMNQNFDLLKTICNRIDNKRSGSVDGLDGKHNGGKMNLTMNLNLLTGMFKSIDNNRKTQQISANGQPDTVFETVTLVTDSSSSQNCPESKPTCSNPSPPPYAIAVDLKVNDIFKNFNTNMIPKRSVILPPLNLIIPPVNSKSIEDELDELLISPNADERSTSANESEVQSLESSKTKPVDLEMNKQNRLPSSSLKGKGSDGKAASVSNSDKSLDSGFTTTEEGSRYSSEDSSEISESSEGSSQGSVGSTSSEESLTTSTSQKSHAQPQSHMSSMKGQKSVPIERTQEIRTESTSTATANLKEIPRRVPQKWTIIESSADRPKVNPSKAPPAPKIQPIQPPRNPKQVLPVSQQGQPGKRVVMSSQSGQVNKNRAPLPVKNVKINSQVKNQPHSLSQSQGQSKNHRISNTKPQPVQAQRIGNARTIQLQPQRVSNSKPGQIQPQRVSNSKPGQIQPQRLSNSKPVQIQAQRVSNSKPVQIQPRRISNVKPVQVQPQIHKEDEDDDDDIEILSVSINRTPILKVHAKAGRNGNSVSNAGVLTRRKPLQHGQTLPSVFYMHDDDNSTSNSSDMFKRAIHTPPPPELLISDTRTISQHQLLDNGVPERNSVGSGHHFKHKDVSSFLSHSESSLSTADLGSSSLMADPPFRNTDTTKSLEADLDELFGTYEDNSQSLDLDMITEDRLCDSCGSTIKRGMSFNDHSCEWLCQHCGKLFGGQDSLDDHSKVCFANADIIYLISDEAAKGVEAHSENVEVDIASPLSPGISIIDSFFNGISVSECTPVPVLEVPTFQHSMHLKDKAQSVSKRPSPKIIRPLKKQPASKELPSLISLTLPQNEEKVPPLAVKSRPCRKRVAPRRYTDDEETTSSEDEESDESFEKQCSPAKKKLRTSAYKVTSLAQERLIISTSGSTVPDKKGMTLVRASKRDSTIWDGDDESSQKKDVVRKVPTRKGRKSNKAKSESDCDSTTSESEDEVDEGDLKDEEVHIISKKVHKPFCEVCNKKFDSTIQLIEHLILHASQAPYECEKCESFFNRPMELHRHVIQNHRNIHEPRIRRTRKLKLID